MTSETYKGWSIYRDTNCPLPGEYWCATGPDYDASYEGPEDGWVHSGGYVSGSTREECENAIDDWIEDHEQEGVAA